MNRPNDCKARFSGTRTDYADSYRKTLVAMAMVTCLLACKASAEPILLSELIASNGSVVAGNSLFDLFQVTPIGEMPMPDAINVIPIQDAQGNFGIRFQGGFLDGPNDGPSSLTISYRATVSNNEDVFSGVMLAGNPASIGQALVQVRLDLPGVNGDDPLIFDSQTDGTLLMDHANIQPMLGTMNIDLFISAHVTGPSSAATASFVDMTFGQTNIPEPSGLTSNLIAMAGLMLPLRRRR